MRKRLLMIVTVQISRRSRGPGEEDHRGGGSEEEERREEHEDLREDEEQARPPPQQDQQGRRHPGEADCQVLQRATRKRAVCHTELFESKTQQKNRVTDLKEVRKATQYKDDQKDI